MDFLIIVVVFTALFSSIAQMIDKKIVDRGISRGFYFYLMCLSMIPFSLFFVFLEFISGNLRFEFNFIAIVLLILSMIFRYIKQNSVVGILTYLNSYENAAYMTLGIILAYLIDIFIGTATYNIYSIFAIVYILCGVFIIADSKLKIKNLKKDLVIRIVTTLIISYLTYYALKYVSNALFLLIVNLVLTLIFTKNYSLSYYSKNCDIVKLAFLQQTFGSVNLYLTNYIISSSVTLSSCIQPASLIFLLFFAVVIQKTEHPKIIQIIGIISIIAGLCLI